MCLFTGDYDSIFLDFEFSLTRRKIREDGDVKESYSSYSRLSSETKYATPQQASRHRGSSTPKQCVPVNQSHGGTDLWSWDFCWKCLAFLVLVGIALYIIPLFRASSNAEMKLTYSKPVTLEIVERFEAELKLFQDKFMQQSSVMLRTVKAASKSVMKESYRIKPGVILLAGPTKAKDTVDCIARHVANMTSKAYKTDSFVEITHQDLMEYNDYHDMKKYLEDRLRSGFTQGRSRSFV